MPQSASKPSRRGGRRPGAGAPKGNLNALKHGLRSRQMRDLALMLARSPTMRTFLSRAAQLSAQRRSQLEAEHAASLAVAAWIRHRDVIGRGAPPIEHMPPPLTDRAVRLLAKRLAHQAIKDGLVKIDFPRLEDGTKK